MKGLLLSLCLRGGAASCLLMMEHPEHLNHSLQPSLLWAGSADYIWLFRYLISHIALCSIPLDLANSPTSFFDSGVHMALQGWVLIEEPFNCSDMLHVYCPTVNLVMFPLGLDLWGNECQMKMHLNSLLCLLS